MQKPEITDNAEYSVLLTRATYASVFVAVVLILIKVSAFFITNSVSLLSSLVDSSMDLLASLIHLFAVRQALVPADENHRFGHGKAEPLAGLGQATFIAGSSVFLCFEAVNRLMNPVSVEKGLVGILVMLISMIFSIGLVLYQRHVIRQTQSLAISADSLHYVNDIAINIAVIIALLLSVNLGWTMADPIFAILIAMVIMYSVWIIASQSLSQLMDTELPDEQRNEIVRIAMGYPDVHGIHDLRTRVSGPKKFIQIHLELDGQATLEQAHEVADSVENDIRDAFPGADVMIHQDPR